MERVAGFAEDSEDDGAVPFPPQRQYFPYRRQVPL